MIIAHNMMAYNAERHFNIVNRNKSKHTEKLSSGFRINRAADDAAGLSISEKMRAQIRGLNRASKNINEGIDFVKVADGALDEVDNILQRMRELSVQALNDVNTEEDREAINHEIKELLKETERIFKDTEYNTLPVFHVPYTPNVTFNPVRYSNDDNTYTVVSTSLPPGAVMDQASLSSGHMAGNYTAADGTTYHAASTIDFSGINLNDLSSLDGTGFYSTCCTCDDHYSITFDSSTAENSVTGTSHYTYKVGIANCSSAADVVNAIVNATGGSKHFTDYAVDPRDPSGNTLLIYDNRPSQTAGGEYGIIGAGVTYETSSLGTSSEIQIFSSGLDDNGKVIYGGIEVNDVRHTWDEMGIPVTTDGRFIETETYDFHDYSGERIILNTVAGEPIDTITRTYVWSADTNGVYINNVFAETWEDIGIKETGNKGSYTIHYRNFDIDFSVNDGDDLKNVIDHINGDALDEDYTWEMMPTSHVYSKAAELDMTNVINVSNANIDKLEASFTINADQSGVSIRGSDGTEYTKMTFNFKDGVCQCHAVFPHGVPQIADFCVVLYAF